MKKILKYKYISKNMSSTKIQIIDYTERSFAVVGEGTKLYKEDLKKLGGRYNQNLKCGAGWIFSKKAMNSVRSFLDNKKALAVATKEFCKKEKKCKPVYISSESDSEEINSSSSSESDSEEPVTKSTSSSESDSEEPVTKSISYKEYERVVRELEVSKKKEEEMKIKCKDLEKQLLECEESKKLFFMKYKDVKKKFKEFKNKLKTSEVVSSQEIVENPVQAKTSQVVSSQEIVENPVQAKTCVTM